MEVSQLAGCTAWPWAERDLLARLGREVNAVAGERVQMSAADDELYVIVEGEALISHPRRADVTRLGPGRCFGDLSVPTGWGQGGDVTAATPLRLLAMGPAELARLLAQSPWFARWLVLWLIERVPPAARWGTTPPEPALDVLSW